MGLYEGATENGIVKIEMGGYDNRGCINCINCQTEKTAAVMAKERWAQSKNPVDQ